MDQQSYDQQFRELQARKARGEISDAEYASALERLMEERQGPGDAGAGAEDILTQPILVKGQEVGHPHRFRLIEPIGSGGMGEVWKAVDLQCKEHWPDRDCLRALKFPPVEWMRDQAAKDNLKREADAAKLLNCPHTVKVYGWHEQSLGEDRGSRVFIEMDYLKGKSFQQHLQSDWKGGLPFDRVLELIRPVAQALDCAHREKLIHRDIKPANLFLLDNGDVQVLDFGIADEFRKTDATLGTLLKARASSGGTPGYMAPEVSTRHPEPRQDVHALACVIYELLTGRAPFYITPETPRQSGLLPEKPEGLTDAAWDVLKKGFAYEVEQRPASAGDLVMALDAAQAGSPHEAKRNAGKKGAAESLDSAAGAIRATADDDKGSSTFAWGKVVVALLIVIGLGGAWQQGWIRIGEVSVSDTETTGSSHGAQSGSLDEAQRNPGETGDAPATNDLQAAQRIAGKGEAVESPDSASGSIQATKTADQGSDPETQAPAPAVAKAPEPPPPAHLVVRSNVYDDELWIDGEKVGETSPKEHRLPPGPHKIEVKKAGYEPFEETLELESGERQTLMAWLAPLPGRLEMESNIADAELWVDGKRLGVATGSYPIPAGPHRVEVRKAGYRSESRSIRMPPGGEYVLNLVLEELPPPKPRHQPYEPEMVRIGGGCYRMGSPESEPGRDDSEGPVHRVCLKAFELGKYEVTFDQWDACVADGGCSHKPDDEGWGRGNRPVINVNWKDAQAYIRWLNRKTGKQYRLPSESEWEYAARGGTRTPYYTGDCISTDQANYSGIWDYDKCGAKMGKELGKTTPVGSYPPNPFGLHDMVGNVWEWVQDCWNNSYEGAPMDGSAWERGECGRRVLRGGSWFIIPTWLRSASRLRNSTGDRLDLVGFRLARTVTP